jgi:hypothetical protein
MIKGLLKTAIMAGILLSAQSAQAAIYNFSQTGFEGGGSISGSFTGTDLNNDGFIQGTTFIEGLAEINTFTVSWSGNSTIAAFSQSLSDLTHFSYDTSKNLLGDVFPEGIATNWFGQSGFQYLTGQGVNSFTAGYVRDAATGVYVETFGLVNVAAVPVPGAVWLFGSALAGFLSMKRRQA